MNHSDSSSIARILASPWQQQRNARSALMFWGALALWLLVPAGLYGWNELKIAQRVVVAFPDADRRLVVAMHHNSVVSAMTILSFWLMFAWFTLVNNVLRQNHPTFARLVPGHVARLRAALLVAWAVAILAEAAGPGFVLDAPLEWAIGVAAMLSLVAAAQRWPVLWLVVLAGPWALVMSNIRHEKGGLADTLISAWHRDTWLVSAIVLTAGALALVAVVREKGRDARALYEAGRAFGRRFARPQLGCASEPNYLPRPYLWWMTRLLARRDSSVRSRLLLGFGSAIHWTTRVRDGVYFATVAVMLCAAVVGLTTVLGRGLSEVLPWLAFGLLTGACTPALQAAARLQRTQREQALLVLLPGVPRGARLNRWLGWQMSALFVMSALWGCALAGALDAFAEALSPGAVERSGAGITQAIAAVLLPQVAWQWRRWARLSGASGWDSLPAMTPFLLGGVMLVLHTWAGVGYLAMAVAFALMALAWCAWRWWRMGSEPTAMPIGRFAR